MSFTEPKFNPPFIAHRGASALAPENTLAAFLLAKQHGAFWVEFDVMLSADGEAVVIHDESVARTTNGQGDVDKINYVQLAQLDAGSWFHPRFAAERIPTLQETIILLNQQQLAANIEIKAILGQEHIVVRKVLADIKEFWAPGKPSPMISSFSMPILQHVRQQQPDAMIGMLIHEWFVGWEDVCAVLQPHAINLNQAIITPAIAARIKQLNKSILCYTVNDIHRAQELFAMGVDAVFTDKFIDMAQALAALKT